MSDQLVLHGYSKSDGTDKLITNREGVFKIYNPTTEVWDNVATPVLDPSTLIDSENFLDYAFFVNGTSANASYNGSWGTTNLSDSPKAKYIKEYNLRLYLGYIDLRGTSYASRVWFSDYPKNNGIKWHLETGTDLAQTASSAVITSAGSTFLTNGIQTGDKITIENEGNAGEYTIRSVDSNTQLTLTAALTANETNSSFWVGSNWFDVKTNDGDYITGFGGNSNDLLIYKRNSVHKYNDISQILRQIKTVPGTTSGRSIVDLNEYTYWFHPKSGIWRTDGVNGVLISSAIEFEIQSVASSMYTEVVGWSREGHILEMYVGNVTRRDGSTVNNAVAMYDTMGQTWSFRSLPWAIEQSTLWVNDNVPDVYVSTNNGKVLKVDNGYKYDTYNISCELEDQAIFPEGDDVLVDFQRLRVFIENGHGIQVMYKLLYMPTEDRGRLVDSDWYSLKGTADAGQTEFIFESSYPKRACGIIIKFIESSGVESFVLDKYILYYSNPGIL